jgi:hypothetical protein
VPSTRQPWWSGRTADQRDPQERSACVAQCAPEGRRPSAPEGRRPSAPEGRRPSADYLKLGFLTWNEIVCVSSIPVIVTVYVPTGNPVVSTLTVTAPLPSGPFTVSASGELSWGPLRAAVTSSQVWPGTVDVGLAYGPVDTPYCPGSGG